MGSSHCVRKYYSLCPSVQARAPDVDETFTCSVTQLATAVWSPGSGPAVLGVEHLSQQVVAVHFITDVSAVQVVFSKAAERAELRETQQQMAEASMMLRGGGAQCVLQQSSLSLLLNVLYDLMLFKLSHIWKITSNQ